MRVLFASLFAFEWRRYLEGSAGGRVAGSTSFVFVFLMVGAASRISPIRKERKKLAELPVIKPALRRM